MKKDKKSEINEEINNNIFTILEEEQKDKGEDKENALSSEETNSKYKNEKSHLKNSSISLQIKDIKSKLLKGDYLITIYHSKIFHIQYFKFGSTINWFWSCSLKEKQMKLSQISTPPFSFGPECKFI